MHLNLLEATGLNENSVFYILPICNQKLIYKRSSPKKLFLLQYKVKDFCAALCTMVLRNLNLQNTARTNLPYLPLIDVFQISKGFMGEEQRQPISLSVCSLKLNVFFISPKEEI